MNELEDAVAKEVIKFLLERGYLSDPLAAFDLGLQVKQLVASLRPAQDTPPAPSPSSVAASDTNASRATEDHPPVPAVPIKQSIQGDYIVCLEDGQRVVLLGRYIKRKYNMTPDQYRIRWGLPPDYPMVAPNFAERKSQFARKIGFGKSHRPAFKEYYAKIKQELGVGAGAKLQDVIEGDKEKQKDVVS